MTIKTDNLNIAFFGTSDKSVPILEALHTNFNLVLCVTKTDTKIGRKHELHETAVKSWAKTNNIKFIEINSLKDSELADVKGGLIKHGVDLGVVADFNYIIPNELISTIRFGLVNIHFSLLPKYRGASPVQHAILNGEETTGITYQLIDKGMDTGDIIYQIEHKLSGTETTESLYNELFKKAADNLEFVLNGYLDKTLLPKKQNETLATYCYSNSHPKSTYIYKEDARVDWNESFERIERATRAYYPWPITWTTFGDLANANIYVNKIGISNNNNTLSANNTELYKFVTKHNESLRLKIYNAKLDNEILKPETVQVEGKNKMTWSEFLNGYAKQ